MRTYLILVFIFLLSCQNRQDKGPSTKAVADTVPLAQTTKPPVDTTKLEEFFADSLNIGRKSFNKIEVSKYSFGDSDYVIIRFYSKQNDRWVLVDNFQFEKDDVTGCDTKLNDFNNDGLNDMTYISAVAARGANEVRRLFIYNKAKDRLVYIKNSEDFPNMLYNRELDCIDAFLVYGGCSTVFLKISGDSLNGFASVELMDGLTVTEFDKNGNEKVIFRDKKNKAAYVRYKNYKPLKVYEDSM